MTIVIVGKSPQYKRNKTICDMLLQTNNQLQGSHHPVPDYFLITTQPVVFYFLLIRPHPQVCNCKHKEMETKYD